MTDTTDCLFCNEDTWGLDESDDGNGFPAGDRTILPAEWIVAGYSLCEVHALQEVNEIITDPGNFVHHWPTGVDRATWGNAVPFYFEVRMIET